MKMKLLCNEQIRQNMFFVNVTNRCWYVLTMLKLNNIQIYVHIIDFQKKLSTLINFNFHILIFSQYACKFDRSSAEEQLTLLIICCNPVELPAAWLQLFKDCFIVVTVVIARWTCTRSLSQTLGRRARRVDSPWRCRLMAHTSHVSRAMVTRKRWDDPFAVFVSWFKA